MNQMSDEVWAACKLCGEEGGKEQVNVAQMTEVVVKAQELLASPIGEQLHEILMKKRWALQNAEVLKCAPPENVPCKPDSPDCPQEA